MKKTLNVNIGSVAFVIDEDAYYILRKYLDDVGERFEPVEAAETLNDLEMRIAEPRRRPEGRQAQADIKCLRRSRSNRVIGGVCGGLAAYFGIDVAVVRLLMFLLIFFGGISLWVYIILWIVIPSEA